MTGPASGVAEQLTRIADVKYLFVGLLLLLLLLAVGHLYAFTGLTALYLGLPLWAWLELAVLLVMLCIAWIAVQLVVVTTEGAR